MSHTLLRTVGIVGQIVDVLSSQIADEGGVSIVVIHGVEGIPGGRQKEADGQWYMIALPYRSFALWGALFLIIEAAKEPLHR